MALKLPERAQVPPQPRPWQQSLAWSDRRTSLAPVLPQLDQFNEGQRAPLAQSDRPKHKGHKPESRGGSLPLRDLDRKYQDLQS